MLIEIKVAALQFCFCLFGLLERFLTQGEQSATQHDSFLSLCLFLQLYLLVSSSQSRSLFPYSLSTPAPICCGR